MIRSVVTGNLYATKESARVAAWKWANRDKWYASRTKSQKKHPLKHLLRNSVYNAVKMGRMLPARALPCFDCRNKGEVYDHYLGYSRKYRYAVQAVCLKCSMDRDFEKKRRKGKHGKKQV